MSRYRWGWFHDWKVVGAIIFKAQDLDQYGRPLREAYQATRVLLRCTSCGKVKTDTLRGEWTLQQLLGKSE